MTVRLEWPDLPLVAGDPAPSWAEWRDGKWYARVKTCVLLALSTFLNIFPVRLPKLSY